MKRAGRISWIAQRISDYGKVERQPAGRFGADDDADRTDRDDSRVGAYTSLHSFWQLARRRAQVLLK